MRSLGLLKNLQKCVSNLLNRSSIISKEEGNHKLLLQRFHGGPVDESRYYFSALSGEDFSATKQINSYLFEDFKVVVGSCNGLVCLDNTTTDSLLWNPTTDEFRIIPSSEFKGYSIEARKHSISSGFGYDSESNDYKIVRCNHVLQPDPYYSSVYKESRVEVYSLKSDSWRMMDHPGYWILRNPSAYVDGVSYWMAYGEGNSFLLGFDYVGEKFQLFNLPNVGTAKILDFVVVEGMLGVLAFSQIGTEKKAFSLWLKEERYWSKTCEFCVAGVDRALGFWGNLLFCQGMTGQLIMSDISNGKVTDLNIYDQPGKLHLLAYAESIVSINQLQGKN